MAMHVMSLKIPSFPIARASGLPFQKPTISGRSNGSRHQVRVSQVSDAVVTDAATPAVLPGTPTDFPIPPEDLIRMAKSALLESNVGVDDDSVLADDFRFEFPVISLDRAAYLKAVRGFGLKTAIPDIDQHPYHWRVDPYEPNRVWYTIRTTGTHTGPLNFGSKRIEATHRVVRGAPECCSMTFNSDGKVTSFTGGYVMDRRVGNTGGLGALFGVMTALGIKVPMPGTIGFSIAMWLNTILMWFKGLFGRK